MPEALQKDLEKEVVEKYDTVKGAIEFSTGVGSILGLTILAPQVSHVVLHPIMKAIGIDKKTAPAAEIKKAEKSDDDDHDDDDKDDKKLDKQA